MAPLIAVLQNRGGTRGGISFSKSTHQPQHFKKIKQKTEIHSPNPTTNTEDEKEDLKQGRF